VSAPTNGHCGEVTNPLTIPPERLDRLRQICLAFPEASEKEAWGDPTWRVGDRIFAMQKGNVEGGRPSVWFKAPEGVQALLVGSDPDRFFVPPYVGHKGWVGTHLDGSGVDWEELADLVDHSYRLVAPKRLVARLDER
jgi:predicted DNA-binding protein (MmcQ/YjbR family)